MPQDQEAVKRHKKRSIIVLIEATALVFIIIILFFLVNEIQKSNFYLDSMDEDLNDYSNLLIKNTSQLQDISESISRLKVLVEKTPIPIDSSIQKDAEKFQAIKLIEKFNAKVKRSSDIIENVQNLELLAPEKFHSKLRRIINREIEIYPDKVIIDEIERLTIESSDNNSDTSYFGNLKNYFKEKVYIEKTEVVKEREKLDRLKSKIILYISLGHYSLAESELSKADIDTQKLSSILIKLNHRAYAAELMNEILNEMLKND